MYVALALTAVGMRATDVAADYARSAGHPAPLLAMPDSVRTAHGDTAGYLLQHGMSPASLWRLRTRLLTP